jgi:uncharacterized HhH-GPD family protein
LVERGQALFDAPRKPTIFFTGIPEADRMLSDLHNQPHAFVLACVMDRQIKAERAWSIPYLVSQKLGGFSMQLLATLAQEQVHQLMSRPEALHRYVETMSRCLHEAIQRIQQQYGGHAEGIWSGRLSSAEVVYRFLEFEGVGPKIASMATNMLARDFKVALADYYSIDISADVHVRRVFARLGLCHTDPTVEQVIYKARALHPEFPGILDFACWEIGRTWCKPREPDCGRCSTADICPTAPENR